MTNIELIPIKNSKDFDILHKMAKFAKSSHTVGAL